jgi:hypothetical protein
MVDCSLTYGGEYEFIVKVQNASEGLELTIIVNILQPAKNHFKITLLVQNEAL